MLQEADLAGKESADLRDTGVALYDGAIIALQSGSNKLVYLFVQQQDERLAVRQPNLPFLTSSEQVRQPTSQPHACLQK